MGYEELGFGHVKFEMPIAYLRIDTEHLFRYVSLDFRGKTEDSNLGVSV